MIKLKSQSSCRTISPRRQFHSPSCISDVSLFWLISNEGRTCPSVRGNGHCGLVPTDGTVHEPPRAQHTIPATAADRQKNRFFLRHTDGCRHMHIAILHDAHRQSPGSPVCYLYSHINQEKKYFSTIALSWSADLYQTLRISWQ